MSTENVPGSTGRTRSSLGASVIRVALLSFWHVHAHDYAKQVGEHPGAELVAAWDADAERGKSQAEALGVPFHADLEEVLARDDVDAVIVTTATAAHREVMVAAAQAGKHIFTEKLLALTLDECRDILLAVDAGNVALTVSLPRLYQPPTLAIQQVLAAGDLGEVTLVRTRLAHDGAVGDGWLPPHFFSLAECGGGALTDLGCHPMYLARLFMNGMPETVSAEYGYMTGREVEDNAVATLRYSNGALAVVEASLVSRLSPFSIEIYGTEGSLVFGAPEARVLVRSSRIDTGENWMEVQLPEPEPSALSQWVTHIEDGTTGIENVAMAVELTRLMEAANASARSGAPVRIE